MTDEHCGRYSSIAEEVVDHNAGGGEGNLKQVGLVCQPMFDGTRFLFEKCSRDTAPEHCPNWLVHLLQDVAYLRVVLTQMPKDSRVDRALPR